MNKAELSAHVAARTSLSKLSAEGTGCLHDPVFPLAVTSFADPSNSYNQTTLSFPTNSPPNPTCTGPRDEGRHQMTFRFGRQVKPAKMYPSVDRTTDSSIRWVYAIESAYDTATYPYEPLESQQLPIYLHQENLQQSLRDPTQSSLQLKISFGKEFL